ncbi:unnamed protein product [Lathyrus oleraceus]
MVDKHDRLRHGMVAQHASLRREKSQQDLKAPDPSGHAESSTSGARTSPQTTSSSSSHRRRDSSSDASIHPSSRRCQVSLIHAHEVGDSPVSPPTIDASKSVPPSTAIIVDLVPPPEGEDVADAELKAFGRCPVDLSFLPLYLDHIARHIWDGEERDTHKFINHRRKITILPQPNED